MNNNEPDSDEVFLALSIFLCIIGFYWAILLLG